MTNNDIFPHAKSDELVRNTVQTSISRRKFIAGSVGGLALAGGLGGLALEKTKLLSGATDPATSQGGAIDTEDATLVLCTLYGGNDGLNTLVPYSDASYQSARSNIALSANQVIALDGTYGLHPKLTGFKSLWDAGKLAIIRGVGYPDPNLSHFRSMDIWQSAVPTSDVSTGWVGRWMDATGSDPLKAVAVGELLPMALVGERSLGAAIASSQMVLPGDPELVRIFSELNSPRSLTSPIMAAIAQSGADLLRVQATVNSALNKSDPYLTSSLGTASSTSTTGSPNSSSPPARSATPVSGLAGQLDIVNQLITAGLPTKVYSVSQQTYDTHADEVATQSTLLGELDSAVTNFVNQMSADPKGQHAVVFIYSEFGRRVQSNASGGTDHGAASVAFACGPKVKGGYYGEYPDLSKLDENGNLTYNVDFRSIYSTLLEKVIGEDPKVTLDGSFPTVNFV